MDNYNSKTALSLKSNEETKNKLYHLMLLMIGAIVGWLLCYFLPLVQFHSQVLGELHKLK